MRQRNIYDSPGTFTYLIAAAAALFNVALFGGLIYVALHFIGKYW